MESQTNQNNEVTKPQFDLRLFKDKHNIRSYTSFIVQRDPKDIVAQLIDYSFLSQLLPGLNKVDRQGTRPVWKFSTDEFSFELRTSEKNDFSWQLFKNNEYINAGFASLRVLPATRGTLVTIVSNE